MISFNPTKPEGALIFVR